MRNSKRFVYNPIQKQLTCDDFITKFHHSFRQLSKTFIVYYLTIFHSNNTVLREFCISSTGYFLKEYGPTIPKRSNFLKSQEQLLCKICQFFPSWHFISREIENCYSVTMKMRKFRKPNVVLSKLPQWLTSYDRSLKGAREQFYRKSRLFSSLDAQISKASTSCEIERWYHYEIIRCTFKMIDSYIRYKSSQ